MSSAPAHVYDRTACIQYQGRRKSPSDRNPATASSRLVVGDVKRARGNLACNLFREILMQDAFWIAVTIAFFALSIAYVHFCEHVK